MFFTIIMILNCITMGNELNKVEVSLTIAGKSYFIVRLKLSQGFNCHHTFEAAIDAEEMDERWLESPAKIIRYIGQDVNIEMAHRDGSGTNLFKGIVTNVSFLGHHGQQNHVLISGYSSTIRLDGSKTMDSFMDKTLSAIVSEVVDTSGNGGSVTPSPKFSGPVDYIAQYDETAFEFLNRLSWIYGEQFGYDGTKCHFGRPGYPKGETIFYDTEMTRFDLSANMLPSNMKRYHYLVHNSEDIDQKTPDNVPGVSGYHQVAKDQSASVYTSNAVLPAEAVVRTMKELEDLVKAEKNRSVADMLVLRGSTQTSKVKIGGVITVMLPASMQTTKKEVGHFLVTEVTHEYDLKGEYRNFFSAIPSEMENIPMKPVPTPNANPQLATVKQNVDEKEHGRIKVQLQWQKKANKTTNWIRVQTLDAGASGAFPKNRGHVFIPETGDQVMIGFEYGDPSRPFVSGSMFPENKGEGVKAENYLKSIKTRSGHVIEFNDDLSGSWGITIKDDCGNTIHLSTKDKNIEITAPETIRLSAKNIDMNANENIRMSAGEDMIESAGKNKTDSTGEKHVISAKNQSTYIDEDMYTEVKKNLKMDIRKNTTVTVDGKVQMKGSKISVNAVDEDMFLKATGKITLKSGDIVDVAQG
jgi:uncharacterized protein involved in type VI secretion and phage assembly